MNGRDLIILAGHLVQNKALGNNEARYRSAISRAYYGAFHLVVAFLAEHNCTIAESGQGHESAYRQLFDTKVEPAKEAARHLNDLRRERIRADYRLGVKGLDGQQNAMDKVEMAETVRSLLDKCRIEPTRTAVAAALNKGD
jgi:uncharacterized protein (UPF0332 family)